MRPSRNLRLHSAILEAMVRAMALAFVIIGGVFGALVALGALLTLGLGPVAALVIFWIAGLAATLALAADFARNTTLAAATEEAQATAKSGDNA